MDVDWTWITIRFFSVKKITKINPFFILSFSHKLTITIFFIIDGEKTEMISKKNKQKSDKTNIDTNIGLKNKMKISL